MVCLCLASISCIPFGDLTEARSNSDAALSFDGDENIKTIARGDNGGRFIDTFYDTSYVGSNENIHHTSHGFIFNRTGFIDDPAYLDEFNGLDLNTRWTNGTTQGGSGATLDVDGGYLKVLDYGTNGSVPWHGPFFNAEVSTQGPFVFELGMECDNSILNEIGRINISLLNDADEVVFSIGWEDTLNLDNRATLVLLEGSQELYNSGLTDYYQSFNGDLRLERLADKELRFAVNKGDGWFYQSISAPSASGLTEGITKVNISVDALATFFPLTKCWFTHVGFTGSLETSGSLTSLPITVPPGYNWDHFFVDWTTPLGSDLLLQMIDGSTMSPVIEMTSIFSEGEADISAISIVDHPSLAIHVTFTGSGLVTPSLNAWGMSWVRSQSWQDNLFEGVRFSSHDSVDFGSGVVTLSRPNLFEEDFTSEPQSRGWSFDSSGSGSIRWTTSVYSSPLYSLFINEPENSVTQNDAGASITVSKPSDDAELDFSAMVMNNNVKKYNLISYRVVLAPEYNMGEYGQLYVLSPSGPSAVSGFSLHFGDWHHYNMLFYSSSNTVRLTIDGVDYGVYPCYPVYPDQLQIGAREDEQDFGSFHVDDIALRGSYSSAGSITSVPIPVPFGHYYNVLEVDKEVNPGTQLRVTALDGKTGEPIAGFIEMDGTSLNLSGIDPIVHPSIMFEANLTGSGGETPVLRSWSLSFSENQQPMILSTENVDSIPRGSAMIISINASDVNQDEGDLLLNVSYLKPNNVEWESSYISRIEYETNHWEVVFSAPLDAEVGTYTIRIGVTDVYGLYTETFDIVAVVNNPPEAVPFFILPDEPTTLSDLEVFIRNPEDVLIDMEGETIDLRYEWYKTGVLQPGLNTGSVSSELTSKGDEWKCVIVPNDGHEDGPPSEVLVNILNHAPIVIATTSEVFLDEDTSDSSLSILDIFEDPDGDDLDVSIAGNQEIEITMSSDTLIITPKPDWSGNERITLTANDSQDESSWDILVSVENSNDVPVIQKVGNTTAVSGIITLNLTEDVRLSTDVDVHDVDNDTLSFYCNRSEKDGDNPVKGFSVDKRTGHIEFLPTNKFVGTLWAKLTVSDGDMANASVILKMVIENINDPPSVNISEPDDKKGFSTEDGITFRCIVEDPDSLHSQEQFTYIWRSSLVSEPLGDRVVLNNVQLEEGDHVINVTVMDSEGASAHDEITVIVVEGGGGDPRPSKDKEDEVKEEDPIDLGTLLFSLVVFAGIIGVILGLGLRIQETRAKIKEDEDEEEEDGTVLEKAEDEKKGEVKAGVAVPEKKGEVKAGDTAQEKKGEVKAGVAVPEKKGEVKEMVAVPEKDGEVGTEAGGLSEVTLAEKDDGSSPGS